MADHSRRPADEWFQRPFYSLTQRGMRVRDAHDPLTQNIVQRISVHISVVEEGIKKCVVMKRNGWLAI